MPLDTDFLAEIPEQDLGDTAGTGRGHLRSRAAALDRTNLSPQYAYITLPASDWDFCKESTWD
jgi:hypothetical protein